ncbi:type II toxin-antitoxin system VapC family toxin [Pyrobaculum aerophilum]|uniref:Ribonuclease VapC n=2 Tax=Pyrobaculum aerophilum TaxID=13773 RepID=Q8ZZX4_PYRAE|nr:MULTISPECIES: type II toxin-antitoxin system VapC family toxin [Pyrobaculum]AAL62515.1 conserved hypothetical protein [Pyrobaculum aerophilum str. IM2]MCX8136596.1 type II toxin-antitoxin system VapC family toxin [Pyrobaculum aerophilum]HII47755.1 type II toxin-antitoxin system VapC family toxin [Pyrobaculum aerophilum]
MGASQRALLDTSVLIEILDKGRLSLLPKDPYLSVISIYEYIRYKRDRHFYKERLEEAFSVLGLTNKVIERAAEIFASLKARGVVVSDNDVFIAATAVAYGLPLITKDRYFLKIKTAAGLDVVFID